MSGFGTTFNTIPNFILCKSPVKSVESTLEKTFFQKPKDMHKVFRIEYNQEIGRHAVSTVNIEPGFTIIDEEPMIRGPVVSSTDLYSSEVTDELVCTNCFRTYSISEANTLCWDCRRNVFCAACANENQTKTTLHKENECIIFQHIKQEMLDDLDLKSLYNLISTIRVLFIRFRDDIKWRQICSLQSKVEEFITLGTFDFLDKIFDTISWEYFRPCTEEERTHPNISGASTDSISKTKSDSSEKSVKEVARFANGVLRVNSYSCVVGTTSNKTSTQFEGLYFFTALLAHSCLMNTDRQFDLNSVEGRMIVKAAVPIKKGEIITTTYLPLMNNNQERQEYMKKNWLMTCHCKRCQDETEFQTHLSTVTITDKRKAEEILKEINLTIPKNVHDIESIEMWLKKYDTGQFLHPNYSVFSQVKYCLSLLYGRSEGIDVLTQDQLVRKLELCQQCLQIFVTLYPGVYQVKGELLFELWLTIRELNRRNVKFENILEYTDDKAAKEAHDILKFSIKNSSYHHMDKILIEECSNL